MATTEADVIERRAPAKTAAPPAPRTVRREKDLRVESLRGLAIILMVAGHVIGAHAEAGMHVDDASGYRYFYYSFLYLRMPLFSVISGFVYSLAPIQAGSVRRFYTGKARRILLPFFCVLTLQFFVRMTAPGVQTRSSLSVLPIAYLYGFDQFWFLQAIFVIFLLVGALELLGGLSTFPRWALAFAAAVVFDRLGGPFVTSIFSTHKAFWLLPYFLLGCGIQRFPSRLFHPLALGTAGVLFAIAVAMQQGAWFGRIPAESLTDFMIPAVVGLTGNLLLMRYFPAVRSLAFYGAHAYTIFLLHLFFTTAARLVMGRVGLTHQFLIFSVSLLAGITLPIVAERGLVKSPILRRALLGLR